MNGHAANVESMAEAPKYGCRCPKGTRNKPGTTGVGRPRKDRCSLQLHQQGECPVPSLNPNAEYFTCFALFTCTASRTHASTFSDPNFSRFPSFGSPTSHASQAWTCVQKALLYPYQGSREYRWWVLNPFEFASPDINVVHSTWYTHAGLSRHRHS